MHATMTTTTHISQLSNMDKETLIELMLEKERRIQDLERLVEDQKRLRLQDSSQVEEKAAKIKEWVTNKLKELENQNKLLRDQNRKQKEAVESLSTKLATLSPLSSPRKRNSITSNNNNHCNSLDRVQYIDQHSVPSSPIHTIDVNKSLRTRRPQLKKGLLYQQKSNSLSSDECHDSQNLRITLNSSGPQSSQPHHFIKATNSETRQINRTGGVSLVSIGDSRSSSRKDQRQQQDSPLYDTVNIELVNSPGHQQQQQHRSHTRTSRIQIVNSPRHDRTQAGRAKDIIEHEEEEGHYDRLPHQEEPVPPPPPMHQFDRWESELYNLAEASFSSLMKSSRKLPSELNSNEDTARLDESSRHARGSASSLRNDIISVIKPSFTTIDGDQVVDGDDEDDEHHHHDTDALRSQELGNERDHDEYASAKNDRGGASRDHLSQRSSSSQNGRSLDLSDQNSIYTAHPSELVKQKSVDSQMTFSSPMRSRSGKDSILRTQSVRRQPAPEKLYDFIAADLVKRGYLTKHGALRSHHRWFVLKNFHLYSYKREAEETDHASPTMTLKLEPTFQVQVASQSSDGYPFKLTYPLGAGSGFKSILLIAHSAQARDEWCQMLTVAINMSDIESESLTRSNSQHEGMLAMTRHGHTKRCHAVLVKHVVFFLKSPIDPTPVSYISVKSAKIREVTDNYDYDLEEQESHQQHGSGSARDCSLAIYPRYSLNLDPVYLTLGSQQDTDEWFYHMSGASGLDQSSGTEFERVLTQTMLDISIVSRKSSAVSLTDSLTRSGCTWRDQTIMVYADKPISQPLTSLPNETLRVEAIELFKSILLFTRVPIAPIAIDYHVCLLQNCLTRFLKYPELRNEFFAQLIKQSTYVVHYCGSRSKLPSISSSGGSSGGQRSSDCSLSPTASECQFVTDLHSLESVASSRRAPSNKCGNSHSMSRQLSQPVRPDAMSPSFHDEMNASMPPPPTSSELLQVMQIIAIAVSVNLPRGRLRWWLSHHLHKFANPNTEVGKYALYSLRAIERTSANGCRDNVPSRTELLGILLRNPYDHSTPHSLPVSFADGSYLVVGADGSTTIEEFMLELGKSINIRPSPQSDFYLFANDPAKEGKTRDLHILEPQRKVLDVVGWWEQSSKQGNIGRQQNTRVIKLMCKKRLVLKTEEGETDQERSLIMSQMNQEIFAHKIPLSEALVVELAALMTQFTFSDYEKSSRDSSALRRVRDHIVNDFIPSRDDESDQNSWEQNQKLVSQVLDHWQKLSGRKAQDCVRVYLNCIRRLRLSEQ